PNYVAAWTNLAELHALEGIRWYHPPRASFEAAREAARRALAVDRGSPGAVVIDGFVAGVLDLDFAGGIARLDEAIATDPSYVIGRTLRGFLLSATGRFDLAEVDLRLALELNPLSAHTHHNLCAMLLFDGRVESALEEARSFAARCPTIDNTLNPWAQFAAMLGSVDEALAAGRMARQLSPATTQMHVGLLMALVAAGRTGEASELLDEMLRAPVPAPPPHLAPALLELGDRAGAVALLERAREARCLHFLVAEFDPRLRDLAGDPDLAPLWSEVRAARAAARGDQRAPSVAARATGVAKRAAAGARR
ncbi:MAG: tetratricopeptide repeat protein, partial [Alphaproteobacteria bacterium]